jgi:hypothetical protein
MSATAEHIAAEKERQRELRALGERLTRMYDPGAMMIWLFTSQPSLEHRTAAALIQQRRIAEINRLLDQIDDGVYT